MVSGHRTAPDTKTPEPAADGAAGPAPGGRRASGRLAASEDQLGARPDLVLPAVPLDQMSRPGQCPCDLGVLQARDRLDVDDAHHPRAHHQEEVRNVAAYLAVDPRHHAQGLGEDAAHRRIEVGEQQAGQLQATLVDDLTARRRRGTVARVVRHAVYRTNPAPRARLVEVPQPQQVERDFASRSVDVPNRRRRGGVPYYGPFSGAAWSYWKGVKRAHHPNRKIANSRQLPTTERYRCP